MQNSPALLHNKVKGGGRELALAASLFFIRSSRRDSAKLTLELLDFFKHLNCIFHGKWKMYSF